MIYGEHALIRTADPDDANAFQGLYDPSFPRAALLNRIREPIFPTLDDARALFKQKPEAGGSFYAIEDREGHVRGFCALRTTQELRDTAFLSEVIALFSDESDYDSEMASEVFAWLRQTAFGERRLNKLIAHAVASEAAFIAWLKNLGFESNGVQREVLFTGGQWHNMETFTLFNPDSPLRAIDQSLENE